MLQDTANLNCIAIIYATPLYYIAASVIIKTTPNTSNLLTSSNTVSRDYLDTPHTSKA